MSRKQKKMLYRILLSAVLLIGAHFAPLSGWLRLVAFLIPYAVIGYDVVWGAVCNILRGQVFDEKFLMALATVGAFATGEWIEAVAVMLFYQVGEWFQSIAVGKSRRSIAKLMDIRPDRACVLRDGEELEVDPDEVQIGETILIRPGEKIPLDGVVLEGSSAIDTSALTGESIPRDCSAGEKVLSGAVNLSGVLQVQVEKEFGESTVSKILELVENSALKKARAERFITRFARYYTPCVVVCAVMLALLPPLFVGEWQEWIHRALIFLVVSCPCALVISVPLSFFGGIGGASRKGILIKGANDLETLSKVKTVVFDKTGTLTNGLFTVAELHPIGMEKEDFLYYAAMAEGYSTHPIAQAIRSAYGKEIDHNHVEGIKELSGRGIRAIIDDWQVLIGNDKLLKSVGISFPPCGHSGTIVHMVVDEEYVGYIVIADQLKADAPQAIAELKKCGVDRLVMLTGDVRSVADSIGAKLGLNQIEAELLPHQKVEKVEMLLGEKVGGTLAFVGDGINDAPVLTRADIGIAMGALGSDAAIEAADVVLMDDQLEKLPQAIRIARKTMAIVRQNIVFSLAVKGLVLVLGAFGLAGVWLAVFADVGVMVLAILNAMRALKL
ncbi:MAG: cadmium-translocating P-type ATPase [Clostridia bacterium]|nr:cadmium-translocating P-type ATPase [Clostridia bacterium]